MRRETLSSLNEETYLNEIDIDKREIRNHEKKEFEKVSEAALPISFRKQALNEFDAEVEKNEIQNQSQQSEYVINANILLKNCEYDYAEVLFRKALMVNSKDFNAVIGLGRSFLLRHEIEKALKCFKAAIGITYNYEALTYLGDCYYFKAEDELAIHYYEESLPGLKYESSRLFDIYKNMGNIYVRKGNLHEAEECYDRAFTIEPDSDVLLVNYGTLEIQKGELNLAQQRFQSALSINKENDKAWLGLALVQREYGDFELSWGSLNRALDINPSNQVSLQLALDWAFRDGKASQMIDRLEHYTNIHDQDAEMGFLLAQVLFKLDRFYHAKMEMEKVLALDPNLKGAEDLMGFILDSIQKMEQRGD